MRIHQLYERLIHDTNRSIADDNLRLQIQFRWVLKIVLAFVFSVGIISLISGDYLFALLIFVFCGTFFGYYWIVYFLKDAGVRIVSTCLIAEALIVELFVLIFGGTAGFSPIWLLIVPNIVFLLLGRKTGMIASLTILAEMIIMFWTPIGRGFLEYPYDPDFMIRLPIIYCGILALAVFSETLRKITVTKLRESKEQMESIYQKQYSSITDKISEAKKTRHDIRHHFVAIRSYLDEGKIEEAKEYMDQYYQSLPFEENLTYCEHYATNALITYYLQRVNRSHIQMDVKVNFPSELPWPTDTLTIIIGNLVENAVDASREGMEESEDFKPHIEIKGNFDGDNLMFKITNNCIRPAKLDKNNQYMSSKHSGHGIGISSVRDIVERNGGRFSVEQGDGTFTANVFMSTGMQNEEA